MAKAKAALKEDIRDKMQGYILEALGVKPLNNKDLGGGLKKTITPKAGGVS